MEKVYNIPKDDPSVVLEEVIMPQVVGLSLANAVAELKKVGIEYEIDGDGSIITKQLQPAGTKIYKGSVVLLVT